MAHPRRELTPWLKKNVVPYLTGKTVAFKTAAAEIESFVGPRPQFWCYFGSYDWYWFCRLWGGLFHLPRRFPQLYVELAYFTRDVPDVFGPKHNALNDARSVMAVLLEQPTSRTL